MVSCLMGVPLRSSGVVMKQEKDHCIHLRYPTTSAGSRSTVEDLILDRFDPNVLGLTFKICQNITFRIPDKDREFPLFPKGNERVR